MAEQTFTSGQVLTAAQMGTLQTDIGLNFISSTTFTSASSFNVAGCFTTAYSNYRVILVATAAGGAAAEVKVNLMVGTTPNTSSNYFNARTDLTYTGTPSTAGAPSTDRWFAFRSNGSIFAGAIDIYNPQVAALTFYNGVNNDTSLSGTCGGMFNASTQFDGFQISGMTTATGTCYVYGYRK